MGVSIYTVYTCVPIHICLHECICCITRYLYMQIFPVHRHIYKYPQCMFVYWCLRLPPERPRMHDTGKSARRLGQRFLQGADGDLPQDLRPGLGGRAGLPRKAHWPFQKNRVRFVGVLTRDCYDYDWLRFRHECCIK